MLVLSIAAVSLFAILGVAQDSTSVALTADPNSTCAGTAVQCRATVTNTAVGAPNGVPQGSVSFSSDGEGYFSESPKALSGGTCSVWYTPTSPEGSPHTITATYSASDPLKWQTGTQGTANVTVRWCVTVQVMGSETPLVVDDWTWVTATVVETSGVAPTPTGTIDFSLVNGDDEGEYFEGTSRSLVGGACMVKYRPLAVDAGSIHELRADFTGNGAYSSVDEYGTYDQHIIQRQADVVMTISALSAYVLEPVDITVCVVDDTTAGTPPDLTGMEITLETTGTNGKFNDTHASGYVVQLDATGCWTGTYTPGAYETGPEGTDLTGVTTLTATFAKTGSDEAAVYDESSTAEALTVNLRPIKTTVLGSVDPLLVYQEYEFTVTVVDDGPTGSAQDPVGTLTYTSSLSSQLDPSSGAVSAGDPTESFDYMCLSLPWDAGSDLVKAYYEATDGVHTDSLEVPLAALEWSIGGFSQGLMRRPTVTTLSGGISSPTGVDGITATVTEDPSNAPDDYNGGCTPIGGTIATLPTTVPPAPPSTTWQTECTLTTGCDPSCDFDAVVPSELLGSATASVTVRYFPNDDVHLSSTDSETFDRSDQIPDEDPTDPSNDGSDCDDGCGDGGTDIENAIYALNSTEVALTAVQMALDIVSLALDIGPDPIAGAGCIVITGFTVPTSDIASAIVAGAAVAIDIAVAAMDTDLDDDGIPDSIEETITHTDPFDVDSDDDGLGDLDEIDEAGGYYGGTRRPNPNVPDSDGDGLEDGDEASLYGTSFCVADTDCDGVSDGAEVATWEPPVNPSMEIRDQADPLMEDTDGDGLGDDIEIAAGCPYVNDDDSDDDGLQDGYEDRDQDGIANSIGNSTAQGSGDTDYCLADTDLDGLLDGEEEGLFGTSVTPKDVSAIVGTEGADLGVTVPALDSDMDDDGLSDHDEVDVYQTDPMDADTDDDRVSDADEVASWVRPDSRDHSNPLEDDTDGDGLTDNLEFAAGCNCGAGTDGYVNDDDSDDDGLQDGEEYDLFDVGADVAAANGNDGELEPAGVDTVCCLCDPDSDGDGLSDGEEVHVGIDPLDWDSDDDGLSDLEEVQIYFTDPNDPDTDDDNATGILLTRPATIVLVGYPAASSYTNIDLGSDGEEALSRTGVSPFGYLGDQSDPLSKDTDGDGIQDDIEFAPGCNCSGEPGASRDGFVNDSDSDDDGIQDGSDTWPDVGAASGNTGELHDDIICSLCDPDSDGDGLSDGEEVHIGTAPLDWDSDDDGLSDREELQTYFTDPNNPDTDGDGAVLVYGADCTLTVRPTSVPLSGYAGGTASKDITVQRYTLVGHTPTYTPETQAVPYYISVALGSDGIEAVSREGVFPFDDLGDQSDPLEKDTDGDGLGDELEFRPSCNCGAGTDGYVNDDDSDNDGLQDGREVELFGTTDVPGSSGNDGELYDDPVCSLCDPDSDGDGLLDGEEDQTGTDALDWDSDEDGLSDREELETYFTDPNDDDTDDDQAEGNIVARDPTVEPTLDGHSGLGTIVTLSDCEEAFSGTGYPPFGNPFDETDPLQVDTDGDGLGDEVEFKVGCSCATTDWCDCPADPWAYSDPNVYGVVYDPLRDGYANSSDSDEDGLRDGEDVYIDLDEAEIDFPGTVFTRRAQFIGIALRFREQRDDGMHSICDRDSDGDGLLDGEEFAIGTDWLDWDTDDDGRNDWHEHTGGGPIPTDPFDPDTDDDGLLDSAEVFGSNTTNPANADTDGDGLCDGGTGTPYMMDWFMGDTTVLVNPICKACSVPGNASCAAPRSGSADGIGDHPNPMGLGEDENGTGAWDTGETDPNQFDTDGDADGDGIEKLGFSTSRQSMIPLTDLFGRMLSVTYPACGCMDPLDPDTDGDGISDGMEDLNHDGNFDFATSDFDFDVMPLLGPPHPDPEETNPCDPDTDDDELDDDVERLQPNPANVYPFNPTNPLDHDTDNDWLFDGYEVFFTCTAIEYSTLDNDIDGRIDEDPLDGLDNDGDGLFDEDPVDFTIRFVPVLDPTDRDSDSDGYIDGLDEDPCNSELIPYLFPTLGEPLDSDGDGFADIDELLAGTSEYDPEDHSVSFGQVDLDFDGVIDDRVWLEPYIIGGAEAGLARAVAIDLDDNILLDLRVTIVARNATRGDFDGDGQQDDIRYVLEYLLSNYRALQAKIAATITDDDSDLVIDTVVVERK